MIYVTGDFHGDIQRFHAADMKRLKRNDYLIICGDFGFLWDGSVQEEKTLRWIGRRKYHVLFLDGSHDNLNLLENYPETEWNGGKTRNLSGKLRYLCRGSVFTLEDKTVFAFGGGEDRKEIEEGVYTPWWEKSLPTLEEIEVAKENLLAHDNQVDYIVTHQPNRKLKTLLSDCNEDANILDTYFDEIKSTVKYNGWYFGGLHLDKVIPPADMAVFMSVIPLKDKLDTTFRRSPKRKR